MQVYKTPKIVNKVLREYAAKVSDNAWQATGLYMRLQKISRAIEEFINKGKIKDVNEDLLDHYVKALGTTVLGASWCAKEKLEDVVKHVTDKENLIVASGFYLFLDCVYKDIDDVREAYAIGEKDSLTNNPNYLEALEDLGKHMYHVTEFVNAAGVRDDIRRTATKVAEYMVDVGKKKGIFKFPMAVVVEE